MLASWRPYRSVSINKYEVKLILYGREQNSKDLHLTGIPRLWVISVLLYGYSAQQNQKPKDTTTAGAVLLRFGTDKLTTRRKGMNIG